MGVYVEVKLHNGDTLAAIEIYRAWDQEQPRHSMPPMQPGVFKYNFKAVVRDPFTRVDRHYHQQVEHERSDDVLALLRAVMEKVGEMKALAL